MNIRIALLALGLLLGGCAGPGVYRSEPVSRHLEAADSADAARCARLFADLDRSVDDAGVRDARATRIPGFPYLRSDRVLGALAARAGEGEQFKAWVRLAAAMDAASRRYEIANLPDVSIGAHMHASREAMQQSLGQCRLELARADLADPVSRARLRAAAQVPAEYQTWKRVLGLYPLSRLAFAQGVRAWQAETAALFDAPLEALPQVGKSVAYAPPARTLASGELNLLFSDASRDALGLYQWGDADIEALFALYAPRFLVDEAGNDDRIGALAYDAAGRLQVDTASPVVYRRLGYTYFAGRWLPQFVYTIWFAARSAQSGADLLAGRFDGLIWRVTVGTQGDPLVYDTIHPCGCYHLFIPTEAVRARTQPETLDETMFAPQSLPLAHAGEPLLLHVQAGTHYLRRVTRLGPAPPAQRYEFAEDDELRSLRLPAPPPGGAQRRSAFGPEGIIAGSERGERYLFWPMGVDNAGAMRLWGRHATAFVGERHFDDPGLFEKYFELR
ncbi:MAG: hypothetical protein IH606_22520 [Burkholderiales bacterium]|nr:hypothetical protein [Burkholderiales bacterium]